MDRLYSNKQMQACANMPYYQVKALDGSRIVSTNDGWEFVQSDIFGLHDYAATGDVLAKHFASREEISIPASTVWSTATAKNGQATRPSC